MVVNEQDFIPFSMHHLQIEDFPMNMPDNFFKGPKYWHIWHKDILLGTLLIEKSVYNNESFFYEDLKRVIASTIQCYQEMNNVDKEPWASYLDNKEYQKFIEYVQKVVTMPIGDDVQNELPISVVICTAGRPKDVEKCLQSLQSLQYKPKEIIVVDNKPGNILMQFLQDEYTYIKWVKEPRIGLDIARNTGLLQATEDIVVYVDDDVLVHKHLLIHIYQSFKYNKNIKALTGCVLPAAINTHAQYQFELFWSFYRGSVDFVYEPEFLEQTLHEGPPVWKIGAGANMAFDRIFLINIGGFDERLDAGAAGCNGDSECWFRVLKNGGSIQYNPRVIVSHFHRKDMEGFHHQIYNYMKGFAAAALMQQNQLPKAGYKNYLYSALPRFYKQLALGRGEYYELRKQTRFKEIYGLMAGIKFYFSNRKPLLLNTRSNATNAISNN
jgi:glycosyltransferase involved in cell wall biosynthesis